MFLSAHTPYAGVLPLGVSPSEAEINLALTRRGKPRWTDEEFQELLYTLGCAGFGWLPPERVQRELERMTADQGQKPTPLYSLWRWVQRLSMKRDEKKQF
jgi:hypothetical protein